MRDGGEASRGDDRDAGRRARHAARADGDRIPVASLLRAHAGGAGDPSTTDRPVTLDLATALARVERERDELRAALVSAEAKIAHLDTVVDAAVDELDDADAEHEAERAEFEDRQTEWELRLTELEKEVQELLAELEAQIDAAHRGGIPDAVAGELERLRQDADAARAEARAARADADTAYAEADAAFAELSETCAELSEAYTALAEAEALVDELTDDDYDEDDYDEDEDEDDQHDEPARDS